MAATMLNNTKICDILLIYIYNEVHIHVAVNCCTYLLFAIIPGTKTAELV
jgi:hypothetical protein